MVSVNFLKPCLDCGDLSEQSRCPTHEAEYLRKVSRFKPKTEAQRARDAEKYGGRAWRILSARARRLQPFCSDCGATEDLTCDHKPSAWQRIEQGKAIRLEDVDVCCRSCNGKRGSAQPGSERAS